MSEFFKVSGKKWSLPDRADQKWEFSLRPGGWVIAKSSQGEQKRVYLADFGKSLSLSLNGQLLTGERGMEPTGGGNRLAGESDLFAQFPGKVRKILVGEEVEVQSGDGLMLIEAMKMEFTVRAPFAGKVKKILVKEGQQVAPGVRLLDLEGASHGK